MKCEVELVATDAVMLKCFPAYAFKPGVKSGYFPVDTKRCRTKAGEWLASKIVTTNFNDDLSLLFFQSAFTNADLKFKAIFDQVQASRVDSFAALEHAKQALKQGLADITLQAQHYSDLEFDYRWTKFEWPVFGSARAGKVETAEAYFDVCGNILARLAPRAVKTGRQEHMPADLLMSLPTGGR